MTKIVVLAIYLALIVPSSSRAERKWNALSQEAARVLRSAQTSVLYSLEPVGQPHFWNKKFYWFKLLGQTALDEKQTAIASDAFKEAVSHWDGISAECFDPRQALRVTVGGHNYDFLICYSCSQLEVFRDGRLQQELGVKGSPKTLNQLLHAAGVRLSKSDSEKQGQR